MLNRILMCTFLFNCLSCKDGGIPIINPKKKTQEKTGDAIAAKEKSEKNIVLAFGASHYDWQSRRLMRLPGVVKDIGSIDCIFSHGDAPASSPTLLGEEDATAATCAGQPMGVISGFTVRKFGDAVDKAKSLSITKDLILAETRQAADAVSEDGTLVWYFAGHGTPKTLEAEDDRVLFDEILTALYGEHRTTPIKRLIVILDSCHSGSLIGTVKDEGLALTPEASQVQGGEPMTELQILRLERQRAIKYAQDMHDFFLAKKKAAKRNIFEQLVIFNSTQATDKAAELAGKGGAFTQSVVWALGELYRKDRDKATLQSLFDKTLERMKKLDSKVGRIDAEESVVQTPIIHASPTGLLDSELLF